MRTLLFATGLLFTTTAVAADPAVWIALSIDEAGQHTHITVPLDWLEDDVISVEEYELHAKQLQNRAKHLKPGDQLRVAKITDKTQKIEVFLSMPKTATSTSASEFYFTADDHKGGVVNVALPIWTLAGLAGLGAEIELDVDDQVDLQAALGKLGEVGPFVLIDSKGPDGEVQIGTR